MQNLLKELHFVLARSSRLRHRMVGEISWQFCDEKFYFRMHAIPEYFPIFL